MLFEKYSGCTNFNTFIDRINISHQPISDELWERFLIVFGHKPSKELIDSNERLSFIESIIELLGDYDCSEDSCEQCGDYSESWTLELEEKE